MVGERDCLWLQDRNHKTVSESFAECYAGASCWIIIRFSQKLQELSTIVTTFKADATRFSVQIFPKVIKRGNWDLVGILAENWNLSGRKKKIFSCLDSASVLYYNENTCIKQLQLRLLNSMEYSEQMCFSCFLANTSYAAYSDSWNPKALTGCQEFPPPKKKVDSKCPLGLLSYHRWN